MAYTYEFDAHLREHRPSRLGQRLWRIPASAGLAVVIAEVAYLAATPLGQVSPAPAVALPELAAFLFVLAWAALSIADWTYPREKYYREAHHAAAAQASAYILAGRRTRGELSTAPGETRQVVDPVGNIQAGRLPHAVPPDRPAEAAQSAVGE
jgi:hypothetical protein